MSFSRNSLAFTLFLGALAALPPLSIDMGLPGIPSIEADFLGASGRGALTLSLFLAGFAGAPLTCGSIADRIGRRPTLLVGLMAFALAAAGCALAPTFGFLLGARLIQGVAAGACVILPLAIVRDLFEGAAARQRFSQVTAVLGIAPMLAPTLGAWISGLGGWRAIYAAQAAIGLVLFMVTWLGFAESLAVGARRMLNPEALLDSYRSVLMDAQFRGYALVYALSFAVMFSFISGSPAVLMDTLGLSSATFAFVFALTSCGMLMGSLVSIRLNQRQVSSFRILNAGLLLMGVGAFSTAAFVAFDAVHVWTLLPPIFLAVFCFGLISPSVNHEALEKLGHVAGAASGVLRGIQMGMGALASALIAVLEPLGHPVAVMVGIIALFASLAILSYQSTKARVRAASRDAALR